DNQFIRYSGRSVERLTALRRLVFPYCLPFFPVNATDLITHGGHIQHVAKDGDRCSNLASKVHTFTYFLTRGKVDHVQSAVAACSKSMVAGDCRRTQHRPARHFEFPTRLAISGQAVKSLVSGAKENRVAGKIGARSDFSARFKSPSLLTRARVHAVEHALNVANINATVVDAGRG